MWKNQASFSEAWDVEKMKEQGSRNGVGRILRRIRGFGALACRRHACGGSAPRRVPARGRNVRPARRVCANSILPRPSPRGGSLSDLGLWNTAAACPGGAHGRFLLAGAKKAPRKGRWEMRITGRPYRSSGGAPPAAFRSHSRGRPSSDPGRSCSWGRG